MGPTARRIALQCCVTVLQLLLCNGIGFTFVLPDCKQYWEKDQRRERFCIRHSTANRTTAGSVESPVNLVL